MTKLIRILSPCPAFSSIEQIPHTVFGEVPFSKAAETEKRIKASGYATAMYPGMCSEPEAILVYYREDQLQPVAPQ